MRVLRVYHGGREPEHRARERALVAAGIDVTLVVPSRWQEGGVEPTLSSERFRSSSCRCAGRAISIATPTQIRRPRPPRARRHARPDRRPRGAVQRCGAAVARRRATGLPVVMYTAQNVDKRYPPPFAQYERAAHGRVAALYPCSRQAAAVARGKGFAGLIEVLPLGYDDTVFRPGEQSLDDDEIVLGLFGRLVPEKGVIDAVEILATREHDASSTARRRR